MKNPRYVSFRLGGVLVAVLAAALAQAAEPTKSEPPSDPVQQALKEIRGQLPSQSHTMADVAYHYNNLWFASQAGNWPLAEFMLNETKSHLRWAVRVRPVRPLSSGGQLQVGDMLSAIEQSTLKELTESVRAKDKPRFETAYKQQLASCYACHVAAEKPYLKLRLPERPAETMLQFDPAEPGSPSP